MQFLTELYIGTSLFLSAIGVLLGAIALLENLFYFVTRRDYSESIVAEVLSPLFIDEKDAHKDGVFISFIIMGAVPALSIFLYSLMSFIFSVYGLIVLLVVLTISLPWSLRFVVDALSGRVSIKVDRKVKE
jgi:hypothetical protein